MNTNKIKSRHLVKSALILLIFTMITKVLGFFRQILVGYKFGPGAITDAFLITNLIPTLIFVDLSMAIKSNYIPILSNIRESNKKSNEFTSNLVNFSLIVMILGIVIINLFPNVVLKFFASGLDSEATSYALVMLRISSLTIIPIMVSEILKSYLQVESRFFSTAIAPVIINIIGIFFVSISSSDKYQLLSSGLLLANILIMIFLLLEAYNNGYRYNLVLNFKDTNLKKMVYLTLPLVVENLASNLNIIVDRNVASLLETGVLTSITYANSVVNILFSVLVTPIGTVIFPKIARLNINNDRSVYEAEFINYSKILIILIMPIIIYILNFSKEISIFLFYRGAVDINSVTVISQAITFYSIGILGMSMKFFITKFFYAIQNTKTPTKISIITLMLNIVLNLILVRFYKHRGIALATSISYTVAFLLLLVSFGKTYNIKVIKKLFISILVNLLSSIVAIAFTRYILSSINFDNKLFTLVIGGLIFISIHFITIIIVDRNFFARIKKDLRF